MTSPTDTYLMEAKKKRRKTGPTAPAADDKQKSALAKNLNHCDIGMSPQLQKLAPLEKRIIGYQDD